MRECLNVFLFEPQRGCIVLCTYLRDAKFYINFNYNLYLEVSSAEMEKH
jgi:hypothetical protein